MCGMRHSAEPPVRGGQAKSTGDATAGGIRSCGRLAATGGTRGEGAAELALTGLHDLPPTGAGPRRRDRCPARDRPARAPFPRPDDSDLASSRLHMPVPSVLMGSLVTDITEWTPAGRDRIRGLAAASGGGAGYAAASLGSMSRGACQGDDPELFFPIAAEGPALLQISTARAVCRRCAVAAMCLAYALQTRQAGIWGGTTQEERCAMTGTTPLAGRRADRPPERPGMPGPAGPARGPQVAGIYPQHRLRARGRSPRQATDHDHDRRRQGARGLHQNGRHVTPRTRIWT